MGSILLDAKPSSPPRFPPAKPAGAGTDLGATAAVWVSQAAVKSSPATRSPRDRPWPLLFLLNHLNTSKHLCKLCWLLLVRAASGREFLENSECLFIPFFSLTWF